MTFRIWTFPTLLCFFLPASAHAADLAGRVELVDEKGNRATDVSRAVVFFTPDGPLTPAKPAAQPFEVATVRKDFKPHVLAIPVGSTVSFPNKDRILHNAFSVSGENRFDLGLYRGGESKEHTFETAGVVQVFCNVHHSMAAYIVVLETPHYTSPDRDGKFRLSGVPEGPGTLTVWHERTDVTTRKIDLPSTETLSIPLTVTKKRVPRHRNKFGKPYSRKRSGRDY